MVKRLHLYVSGLVQGVFFRARTCDKARTLGLTGWVANRVDGRVEIVAEGKSEAMDQFLAWCHKGPTFARVASVEVSEEVFTGEFSDFEVRR